MAYKTILTILTNVEETGEVLAQAIDFAGQAGAHLDVLCLGVDRTQSGYYFAGASALVQDETLKQAQEEAHDIAGAARLALGKSDLSWAAEALVVQSASIVGLVARRGRYADLVILPKPYGEGLPSDAPAVIEAALFQAGAPVIVLGGPTPRLKPRKAVIAWNESAEAMTSIRWALPILAAADAVSICMVAPDRRGPDAGDPGADLSTMLARHSAKVEVNVLPQTLTRVSQVIARHAEDQNADLLVMGAYGHSRFREAILGGATRAMLEHAKLPVFMAH